jgi:hypothetical protein
MTHYTSLEELLMSEMSRRNSDLVADMIRQQGSLFAPLMEIFFRNEEPVSRRAAWVADIVSEENPELLNGYNERMVGALQLFSHDGLKRHTLRMILRSGVSGESAGVLMNQCFDWLLSPTEAVATKVYCMDILYELSETECDLKKELRDSIEWRMEEESPGFRAHGMKVLKKLYRDLR